VLIEVELLAKLSHPNLVSYRHVWLEDVKLNRFGPSVACAFILQQYCNSGDLLHYIIGNQPKENTKEELKAQMRRRSKGQMDRPRDLYSPQRRLALDEIYSVFKDITSGLAYLHAANYIHRDLKPSNCLLHREGSSLVCLISDFGEVQHENTVRKSTGSTGTISYCAPEVLKQDATGRYGNFTTKSDIFSLGMILYFLCFGRLPYLHANLVHEELEDIDKLREEIADWNGFQDERRERPDLPSRLYQLLKRLLSPDPGERPGANEVLAAMKSESTIEGISRGGRSGSPSIGHRIQSLDSPMPPSTPLPGKHATVNVVTTPTNLQNDPAKHASPGSVREDIRANFMTTDDKAHPSIGKVPDSGIARYRTHAMAPSRSQDGHSRPQHDVDNADHRGISPQGAGRHATPLLMAPPTTLTDALRHMMFITWLGTKQAVTMHRDSITSTIRLLLFAVKMMTLARPCWPYMVNLSVGAPLVALAALDLGLSDGRIVSKDGESPSRHAEGQATSRRLRSLRSSMLFLGLHLLVVWVVSRWEVLCAAQHDRWADW
jgi:serine/threonine protein kinase